MVLSFYCFWWYIKSSLVESSKIFPSNSYTEKLKKLPAPEIAVKYYTGGDLYLFGELGPMCSFVAYGIANFLIDCCLSYFQMNFKPPEFLVPADQK